MAKNQNTSVITAAHFSLGCALSGLRSARACASPGRRSFITGAAALVATARWGPTLNASPQNSTTTTKLDEWLSRTKEEALEPQLPIIDPHHHFWNTPERDPQVYLLENLAADVKGHNVRQTVFIECGSMYRVDGPEEARGAARRRP